MVTTEIGRRVRALRMKHGWTQVELADLTGLQQPTVSAIERGSTREPALETLRRLSDVFGVTIEELTGAGPAETLPQEEREEMCERFDGLDVEEQRVLLRLVRRLSAPQQGQG